jgi:3-dehydroquinate synthase
VIGGGYAQDIGTLVASLYMRGVKWIYIPTTLAAMGDSCIGGKSSINAGDVKNLVGNFYPPKEVLVDPSFVDTLPKLEIIAGISEIIKICFAKSFDTFSVCDQLITQWQNDGDQEKITEVIQLSLISKQYFVEEDEFDTGIRKLLNFGHSFGPVIEMKNLPNLYHGEAVVLDCLYSSCLAEVRGFITMEQLKRIMAAAAFSTIAWFVLEQVEVSSLTKAISYGIVGVISPEVLAGIITLSKKFAKKPEAFINKK